MTSPIPALYLDPLTGDIAIDALGQCRLTVDLQEEVAQRLATKFRFFLGEWFLDETLGVPYYRDVLVRNPDMGVIKALFQDLITSDVGVESLVSLDLTLDSLTRVLRVEFSAVLNSGEVLSQTVASSV